MALTVEDFQSNIEDTRRQFHFRLTVTPQGVPNLGGPTVKKLQALVLSTATPSKATTPLDAMFMGRQLKLAGNITYPDWSCIFRVDNDMVIYKAMYEWTEAIRNSSNMKMGAASLYKSQVLLEQLDAFEDPATAVAKASYSLQGAFPSTLGEITLDTTSSEIQQFPVTFAFDGYTYR